MSPIPVQEPDPIDPTAPLTPEAMRSYLGANGATYTNEQLTAAIAAEAADQRARVGDRPRNAGLTEALCRRVARNLAMRSVPLGVQMDDSGGMRIGSQDPEVRRLEAPYRRLVVG